MLVKRATNQSHAITEWKRKNKLGEKETNPCSLDSRTRILDSSNSYVLTTAPALTGRFVLTSAVSLHWYNQSLAYPRSNVQVKPSLVGRLRDPLVDL